MISLKALPVTSWLLKKKGTKAHWRWKRISNQLYELTEVKTAAEPLTDMLKDEKTELEMKTSLELLYPVLVDWNTEKLLKVKRKQWK